MQAATELHPKRVASLSTLPPECLQLILRFLEAPVLFSRGGEVWLARLMQVNSYFCSVALPYLYGPVFNGIKHFFINQTLVDPTLFKAIQTVLRHRPAAEVSDLLSAAYSVVPPLTADEQSQGSGLVKNIDYLSAIRSFNPLGIDYTPQYCVIGNQHRQGVFHKWDNYPRKLAEMVFKSKETKQQNLLTSLSSRSTPPPFIAAASIGDGVYDENLDLPPRAIIGCYDEASFRYAAVSVALRRDLIWTICSPIFEQIEELAIPLSDMKRYLDAAHRLQSLKVVQFTMDEPLQPIYERRSTALTQKDIDDIEKCKQKQDRRFRAMIEFTQRHCELFPSLLRSAECSDNATWSRRMTCPSNIMDELKLCLPPLRSPVAIDGRNWKQVALKLKQTDLSRVEILLLTNTVEMEASTLLWNRDRTFLARCRALHRLNLVTPGAGSFQWAVKERKAWTLHQEALASRNPLNNLTSDSHKKPISLKSVLLVTQRYFDDELDDLVYAFGDTLRYAEFRSNLLDEFMDESAPFSIGRGWRLPKITNLKVLMPRLRLLVDPDFYLHLGSNLQKLELLDMSTLPYEPQEVYTCQPFSETMAGLTLVTLQGWPALTFHPESLHRTPNLKTLDLRMHRPYELPQFHPSTEHLHATVFFAQHPQSSFPSSITTAAPTTEMIDGTSAPTLDQPQPQQLWTWDWYLPHLASLHLDNVFAILFQFRMLAGCPSLRSLGLHLQFRGTTGRHQRVLSTRDFTLSGTSYSPSTSLSNNDSPFIVAPALKDLLLNGGWILDDELREIVFRTSFPGLVTLKENFTAGCSAWGWVKALRFGTPNLKVAMRYVNLEEYEGSEEMLENHGLVRIPPPSLSVFRFGSVKKPEDKAVFTLNGTSWHFAD